MKRGKQFSKIKQSYEEQRFNKSPSCDSLNEYENEFTETPPVETKIGIMKENYQEKYLYLSLIRRTEFNQTLAHAIKNRDESKLKMLLELHRNSNHRLFLADLLKHHLLSGHSPLSYAIHLMKSSQDSKIVELILFYSPPVYLPVITPFLKVIPPGSQHCFSHDSPASCSIKRKHNHLSEIDRNGG